MYCGDETGSFIGDIGSNTSRFGYGGEDSPKYFVSSYVQTDANDKKSIPQSPIRWSKPQDFKSVLRGPTVDNYEQPVVNPHEYLSQGDSVENWDAFETIWESALDSMRVRDCHKHTSKPQNDGKVMHPILATLPGCTEQVGQKDIAAAHRQQLIKTTEIMMEKLECPALFIAPQPMLASFSHGRQTALVVDVGAGGCRVTPIVDGLVLQLAQRRSGRGGDWLGNVGWRALQENQTILRPRYQQKELASVAKRSGIFHRWAMQDLMFEVLTSKHVQLPTWRYDSSVPFADIGKKGDDGSMDVEGAPKTTYELPDGTLVDLTSKIGKDICRIPDLLFTDQVPFHDAGSASLETNRTFSNLPLHKLIKDSLSAVTDVDIRKELAANILLTGGASQRKNLEERLSLEVSRIVAGAFKPKVVASKHSVERSCASWIGGSILTSLGSFQQLWMSRAEYEEYGVNLAIQRFP